MNLYVLSLQTSCFVAPYTTPLPCLHYVQTILTDCKFFVRLATLQYSYICSQNICCIFPTEDQIDDNEFFITNSFKVAVFVQSCNYCFHNKCVSKYNYALQNLVFLAYGIDAYYAGGVLYVFTSYLLLEPNN